MSFLMGGPCPVVSGSAARCHFWWGTRYIWRSRWRSFLLYYKCNKSKWQYVHFGKECIPNWLYHLYRRARVTHLYMFGCVSLQVYITVYVCLQVYTFGAQYWLACFASVLSALLAAFIYVPVLYPLRMVSVNHVSNHVAWF